MSPHRPRREFTNGRRKSGGDRSRPRFSRLMLRPALSLCVAGAQITVGPLDPVVDKVKEIK